MLWLGDTEHHLSLSRAPIDIQLVVLQARSCRRPEQSPGGPRHAELLTSANLDEDHPETENRSATPALIASPTLHLHQAGVRALIIKIDSQHSLSLIGEGGGKIGDKR